jgi:hypothetical protein
MLDLLFPRTKCFLYLYLLETACLYYLHELDFGHFPFREVLVFFFFDLLLSEVSN